MTSSDQTIHPWGMPHSLSRQESLNVAIGLRLCKIVKIHLLQSHVGLLCWIFHVYAVLGFNLFTCFPFKFHGSSTYCGKYKHVLKLIASYPLVMCSSPLFMCPRFGSIIFSILSLQKSIFTNLIAGVSNERFRKDATQPSEQCCSMRKRPFFQLVD